MKCVLKPKRSLVTFDQSAQVEISASSRAEGDLHMWLSDGKNGRVVAECIPKLPCSQPKLGQTIL